MNPPTLRDNVQRLHCLQATNQSTERIWKSKRSAKWFLTERNGDPLLQTGPTVSKEINKPVPANWREASLTEGTELSSICRSFSSEAKK